VVRRLVVLIEIFSDALHRAMDVRHPLIQHVFLPQLLTLANFASYRVKPSLMYALFTLILSVTYP